MFPAVLEVQVAPVVQVALVRQEDLLVPAYRSVLTDRVHLMVLMVLVDQEVLGYHSVQEALGKISELMQNLSLR